MELRNAKINFLGDSITEGHGVQHQENVFLNRIANRTGAICRNYGIGGTRIARQHTPSDNPRKDLHYCRRALEMDEDADIIVVFGGTNDFGHGDAPIGLPSDRDDNTFYGALHTLYSGLKNRYPNSLIVIITPLHRYDDPDCLLRPTLDEYVRIIKEVASEYHLPVLDLYEKSHLHPRTENVVAQYVPDRLHPNDAGHGYLAAELLDFLNQM